MTDQRISRFMTQKRRPKGKLDESDPQKHKVYAMERQIAGWCVYAHVELDDLQRIADYVCRQQGVKRVGITLVNLGKKRIFGWCEDYTIHLNQDFFGDNTAVLVHELAHYVTSQRYPDADSHGPEFVRLYGDILDSLNLFPYDEWVMMCERCGVEID